MEFTEEQIASLNTTQQLLCDITELLKPGEVKQFIPTDEAMFSSAECDVNTNAMFAIVWAAILVDYPLAKLINSSTVIGTYNSQGSPRIGYTWKIIFNTGVTPSE
jgi:hypothetical protein